MDTQGESTRQKDDVCHEQGDVMLDERLSQCGAEWPSKLLKIEHGGLIASLLAVWTLWQRPHCCKLVLVPVKMVTASVL